MARVIKSTIHKFRKPPRTNPVTVMFNDKELRVINKHCERYAYRNRSDMIRKILMGAILKQQDKDSPTLFD